MRVSTSRPRRTRLSGFGCGTAVIWAFVLFALISVVSAGVFFLSPQGSSTSSSVLHPQPGSIPWDAGKRLTMLVIGTEVLSRRAESLTVMSYDPVSRTMTLMSVPSNLWVTIPGFGPAGIGEAYSDGGPRLALIVMQSILQVPIPYYVVITHEILRTVVDDLDGATLRISPEAHLPRSGVQRLNGATALTYVLAGRKGEDGPDGRMYRVQQLLLAIRQQMRLATNLVQVPTILNAIGSSIPSNFPFDQIPDLAHTIVNAPDTRIRQVFFSRATRSVSEYGAYFVPDWQNIRTITSRVIPPPQFQASVDVLNGSGTAGQASSLSDWLQSMHIHVQRFASATSYSYPHTQVVVPPGSSSDALQLARDVGTLLQIPVVIQPLKGATRPVVIIGHDFQDPTQQ